MHWCGNLVSMKELYFDFQVLHPRRTVSHIKLRVCGQDSGPNYG